MAQIPKSDIEKVKSIIADAGGKIIGKTKLQKIAYLLAVSGDDDDAFHFDYHYYGPYSEDLARAVSIASITGDIREEERVANWGGAYSIYETPAAPQKNEIRQRLAQAAAEANAVALELAATAVYFSKDGKTDPWEETKARKPEKAADGRLDKAKELYQELREISERLPAI